MFTTVRKGKNFVIINTSMIEYIEPHKENPNQTVIHFGSGQYLVASQPYEQITQKFAMSGVMQ